MSQAAKRYLTLSRLVLTENSKRNVQAESRGFTKQYFDPITRKPELLADSANSSGFLTYRKLRKNRPREQNFDARRTLAEVNAGSARLFIFILAFHAEL